MNQLASRTEELLNQITARFFGYRYFAFLSLFGIAVLAMFDVFSPYLALFLAALMGCHLWDWHFLAKKPEVEKARVRVRTQKVNAIPYGDPAFTKDCHNSNARLKKLHRRDLND